MVGCLFVLLSDLVVLAGIALLAKLYSDGYLVVINCCITGYLLYFWLSNSIGVYFVVWVIVWFLIFF